VLGTKRREGVFVERRRSGKIAALHRHHAEIVQGAPDTRAILDGAVDRETLPVERLGAIVVALTPRQRRGGGERPRPRRDRLPPERERPLMPRPPLAEAPARLPDAD